MRVLRLRLMLRDDCHDTLMMPPLQEFAILRLPLLLRVRTRRYMILLPQQAHTARASVAQVMRWRMVW